MPVEEFPIPGEISFFVLLLAALALGFLLGRFVRYLSIRKERSEAVSKSRSVLL